MNKKIILAVIFFIFLVIAVPLLQSLFFTQQTNGKIVIEQRIDAPYLYNTNKDLILVFFGYVGCTKVCTPILHELSNFYESKGFAPLKPFVAFSFINLIPELESNQPEMFAKAFNPEFKGIYLSQKELMTVDREFSLFFSKSLRDVREIDHSDHLYLIERQKNGSLILKNIYTMHPLNQEEIIKDILKLQKDRK
ncbi:MAG: SCO family protein [Sulfuricurvum sp.]|nr:SCO family protein [Sulfuricurvum sp.]